MSPRPDALPAGAGGRDINVAFALPGLHRVTRGAEVAFESIAQELARIAGFRVTLFGSGPEIAGRSYHYVHCPCSPRERFERWPRIPPIRDEYIWEEATFVRSLRRRYNPDDFDVTVACSYPFVNWYLRARTHRGRRPLHVYVTQNGDWPAQARNREYRFFGCDALVCTNPVFNERHKDRFRCWLIPNAVDPSRFLNATPDREALGLPASAPVVIMVAALIDSKRVVEGVRAVAGMPGVEVLMIGDGPIRAQVDEAGRTLLGPRFRRMTVPFDQMPSVYRSADVLLHMSKDEPFGNIYVEALAAGLPVVTHDWASTRWLFEDQGVLVDTDDPEAVRSGIRRALETASAVAGRRELVERRFTWRAVADGYAQCLRTLVQ